MIEKRERVTFPFFIAYRDVGSRKRLEHVFEKWMNWSKIAPAFSTLPPSMAVVRRERAEARNGDVY